MGDLDLNLTDEQAAKQVQAGDVRAFELLLARFEPKLLRYGRKFLSQTSDIEDVVQEVFLKAYSNILSYDSGKKFSSWIYRIAHNEFINHMKKQSRTPVAFLDPEVIFPHPVSPENAESDLQKKQLEESIQKFMERLPAKYKEPLILYYFEQLSYDEIAEVMHLPISTVGVRIKRGKDILKKFSADFRK